ncbi:MAG: hypothetical protein AB8B65_01745 [Kordia sp.]|uniref:hypothetical protein n=1 Tax=Kordia sp. TaxID=1965332 RepID=UPI0038600451
MKIEIICPKCNWKPDGGAYWECSCGHVWNTFATAGRCPKCSKTWEDTRCPSIPGGCSKWSKHVDWYRNLDDVMKAEMEKAFKEKSIKI